MALRPGKSAKQTLDYLIDLFTPDIRDAFKAAIQGIVDNVFLTDLITAIEDGEVDRAFELLGFSEAAMRPLTSALERAFETGGVLTGEKFPKFLRTPSGRVKFNFDVRNSRAEAWLRDHSSELVTRLKEETRTNVRNTLQQGMIDGRNPRSTALDLVGRIDPVTKKRTGGIIGLTPNQERWVSNTRRDLNDVKDWLAAERLKSRKKFEMTDTELLQYHPYFSRNLRDKRFDNIVRRAIAEGTPLPQDTIDRLVTAYKNKTLQYRAEVIARTESIQSLNRSEWEANMQAVDMGAIRKQDVTRHWDSAGDTRVRHSHAEMDKKYSKTGVGIDEPFVSPSGAIMMFPGDTSLGAPADEVIQCRCRVRMNVDWLAGWNDPD